MEVSLRGFRMSPVGCRFLSMSTPGFVRKQFGGDKKFDGAGIFKKDAATILEEERNGVFRVLDIGRPKSNEFRRDNLKRPNFDKHGPPRHTEMKPDQDWGSVWPAPRTFHPAVVPLPLRQGVVQIKSQTVPSKYANLELMKIPNFLHLTPPVVKKHCAAIKKFCTPWPVELNTEEQIQEHFPIQVITSNYLNSNSSVRDKRSRIVVLRFKLSSLTLDKHSRDKFIRLVGERYDHESDEVTLTTDRCPYRGQNLEYSQYLLTALYYESWKVEPWEQKEYLDKEEFQVEKEELDEFTSTIQKILNDGEDEDTLREYKESARKLLELPPTTVIPQIVSN
ncbi:28S ribosomal protein S35, mitochondrial [Eurytemora carolleeae]|uniref:28S ribosomal protein S35, mitochondrial n=1 Tax=Eurytemora carolleeae TaxID=1294199 RepID=UPI000C787C2C|nr:28S ribosomal protein S35, mitochondrial [Eurytemora carolleeae]|eukprot:XP_023345696.1 28S ribosomal protein S35, mitochondrial-like [Eurytemora affinis]